MANVIVETATGSLRGRRQGAGAIFRGIPYARPPVGESRFRHPSAVDPWAGVRDALAFGPACPQLPRQPEWNIPEAAWDLRAPMDEDCLYLNIWTPGVDGERRPVLVWVHGGGMEWGAGSQAWFDGAAFADRADAVVVSLNYRLGALGWLYVEGVGRGSTPIRGNAGLHDQILALTWVRDSIEAFGGDPQRVTVVGRSAGAKAVTALLGAPDARGLFAQAGVMSGSGQCDTRADAARLGELVLDELGTRPGDAALLWKVPAFEVVRASRAAVTRDAMELRDRTARFLPVIDGESLPTHPLSAVEHGSSRDVALLITTTANETGLAPVAFDGGDRDDVVSKIKGLSRAIDTMTAQRLLASYRPRFEERSENIDLSALYHAVETDIRLGVPALRLAEAQASAGGQVFLGVFGRPSPDPSLGACHGIDTPFMFDTIDLPGMAMVVGEGSSVRALRDTMGDLWTRFLWHGAPVCRDVEWPPFDLSGRATMVLDEPCRLAGDHIEIERAAWRGVI